MRRRVPFRTQGWRQGKLNFVLHFLGPFVIHIIAMIDNLESDVGVFHVPKYRMLLPSRVSLTSAASKA